ncbi:hypothetical protein [Streptomyces sp. NPDC058671]|uniref:hypothetical protein n=1 Tax=Streptomyces sp. NPDC058671 TaxID=3346590 RepID=UPI00364C8FAF
MSGLPEGALIGSVRASRSGAALVDIVARSETVFDPQLTMVDVAAAQAGRPHSALEISLPGSTHGLSDTHAAWSEGTGSTVTPAIADRGTEKVRRVAVGKQLDGGTNVGVLGTWVTYGTPIGLDRDMDSPPVDVIQALTARSATTDETIRLLDHMTDAVPAPDGTLLVRGGIVGKGEGLYRIAAGDDGRPTAELVASDGRPTAELVASDGRPTELTYLGTDLRMLDLDADPAKTHLKWRMSRVNADVYLKLTHRRSGETFELKMHLYRESAGRLHLRRPDLRCDKAGKLWLYLGKGDGTFAPGRRSAAAGARTPTPSASVRPTATAGPTCMPAARGTPRTSTPVRATGRPPSRPGRPARSRAPSRTACTTRCSDDPPLAAAPLSPPGHIGIAARARAGP